MSDGLTARQTQILKCIIDEYIETAEPVGSESLEKKHSLGVSPATVRNEMAALTKIGFLKQPHTSAGRIPTPKAMKFYVNQLMEEKQMSLTDEVKAKEEVWDVREDINALFREATNALASRTNSLAVGTLEGSNRVWHAGYSNVFANPEFTDLAVCESLFGLLEEANRISELFFGHEFASPVDVLFGEELGWRDLSPIGVVATRFSIAGREGALGVIGPVRTSYPTVIPIVKYFGNLIQEVAGGR
jgi:heat-inducible transcriptional repressor